MIIVLVQVLTAISDSPHSRERTLSGSSVCVCLSFILNWIFHADLVALRLESVQNRPAAPRTSFFSLLRIPTHLFVRGTSQLRHSEERIRAKVSAWLSLTPLFTFHAFEPSAGAKERRPVTRKHNNTEKYFLRVQKIDTRWEIFTLRFSVAQQVTSKWVEIVKNSNESRGLGRASALFSPCQSIFQIKNVIVRLGAVTSRKKAASRGASLKMHHTYKRSATGIREEQWKCPAAAHKRINSVKQHGSKHKKLFFIL